MAFSPTLIGVLVHLEPKEAKERILAAYREVGGLAEPAAMNLGVTKRTLNRWIALLNLRNSVDRIRKKLGESDGLGRNSKGSFRDGRRPPTRSRRK